MFSQTLLESEITAGGGMQGKSGTRPPQGHGKG